MNATASKSPNPKTALSVSPTVRMILIMTVVIAIVLYAIGITPQILMTSYRPHAPDFSVFKGISLMLAGHIAAASTALVVGIVIMLAPKGRGLHKPLGWTWVVAMALTALTSFGLLLEGIGLSVIHGLSGYAMIALPIGIAAIRRRDIKTHRGTMTGLFIGGLMTAAVLTLLPGRLMWRVFFG